MSILQEQAVRMIGRLSEYYINSMQEMENMRERTKVYFPADFDPEKVWEKAVDEKYDSFT